MNTGNREKILAVEFPAKTCRNPGTEKKIETRETIDCVKCREEIKGLIDLLSKPELTGGIQ